MICHSAFFIVQLLHPYMTIGKNTALTRWTFVSKVMSLLFNMLSRLVIAFLPKSKHLLISWLQSLCNPAPNFAYKNSLKPIEELGIFWAQATCPFLALQQTFLGSKLWRFGLFGLTMYWVHAFVFGKRSFVFSFARSSNPKGEGNGTPLQYSCLENPMDREAWWAAVHGVTKSLTQLSDWVHKATLLDLCS